MRKNYLPELRLVALVPSVATLLLSILATVALPSYAADDERNWQFSVALGYGQRSNPLVDGDDIDIYWLADIAWYGKRWFFDNGDIGFTIYEGDRFSLNAIGSVNSDRVFFSHLNDGFLPLESLNGLNPVLVEDPQRVPDADLSREELAALIDSPDRDYAFELGFEFLSDGEWGFLQAQFNSDVSSVHNGHEFWLTYGYDWFPGRWHVQPSVGASWKSAEFNNYYFGVREEESSLFLPQYRTGSGVNYSSKLTLSYLLDEQWKFVLMAEYEKLNNGATNSPFIFEDSIKTYFAGVYYRF